MRAGRGRVPLAPTPRTHNRDPMTSNIILIGPMGAGKTTIGRQLAKRLNKEFVDSDQEIERRTGASISLIFDIEGEEGFRKREASILEELTQRTNIVLATGGGAVLSEANRRNLRRSGTVVYLHASVDTQVERTRNNKNRPLIEGKDPRGELAALMEVREPLYRGEADLTIDAEDRPAASVAKDIIRRLQLT